MPDDIGARVRAEDGLPEVLADLLGAGFSFSSTEEYDKAMEWALRAWRAARVGLVPLDEVLAALRDGEELNRWALDAGMRPGDIIGPLESARYLAERFGAKGENTDA